MLHVDIPSIAAIRELADIQSPGCVSIYVPTGTTRDDAAQARIELKNARDEAVAILKDTELERGRLGLITDALDDLIDDENFWSYQARSLAVFVDGDHLTSFRLPNELSSRVDVSDRFLLKPLLRTVTFAQTAFVLALSQNAARLVEIVPDTAAETITVPDLPTDAASHVGKSSIKDRAPVRRLQGSEGQKVRLRQYARGVDQALRPLLTGSGIPLILASTQPLDGIYRSVNSYSGLAPQSIEGNPDELSDQQLAEAARPILDEIYAGQVQAFNDRFATFTSQGRAITDLSDIARAATAGAVDVIAFDIDAVVNGTVDEQGAITVEDTDTADNYGVVDEIIRRAVRADAGVLAVRAADLPAQTPAAALLRYTL
ncbi:hypothetical protein [Branchiibius cervicis]|uniref:Peptide chain release factor 1 n=1 Tax=Branchiibius cervicis TaxID=908252 RepID=A0ABW2AYZ9_9MICO